MINHGRAFTLDVVSNFITGGHAVPFFSGGHGVPFFRVAMDPLIFFCFSNIFLIFS